MSDVPGVGRGFWIGCFWALVLSAAFGFVLVLVLAGCAAAPAGYKTGSPNCLWHCVISAVDAPEATTLTTTQNGATSVTKSYGGGQ